jgi:hypothetical protein
MIDVDSVHLRLIIQDVGFYVGQHAHIPLGIVLAKASWRKYF